MAGGIYSEERCPFCMAEGKDGRMVDNKQAPERGGAVWCPEHPEVRAHKLIIRFGRRIFMRFQSYKEAYHTLNGLRFKVTEGSYDEREYIKESKPAWICKSRCKIPGDKRTDGQVGNLYPYTA